jgi:hypothetical protein
MWDDGSLETFWKQHWLTLSFDFLGKLDNWQGSSPLSAIRHGYASRFDKLVE